MDEVLKFLSENTPFYIATVENDKARVRPIGFVALHDGKLFFATKSQGNLYRQLQSNPNIEISATNASYEWIRIEAIAELVSDTEVKQELVKARPTLERLSADLEGLGVYCATEPKAVLYSMTDAPRSIDL